MQETAWNERERCLHDAILALPWFTDADIGMLFQSRFGSYLIAPRKSVFCYVEELVTSGILLRRERGYSRAT